jgi:signal transduction histidine kinase
LKFSALQPFQRVTLRGVRMKIPSALTVLTSTLLVLLPALAVLQYRWVGQVSNAERERMERSLRVAAFQFRESLDDEIVRAVISLRADATTVHEGAWYRYADRYETWADSAQHPGIVANIYLVDAETGALRLRRWNGATTSFDAVAWPAPLLAWQPHFERALSAFTTGQPVSSSSLPDDDSIVVAPLLNPGQRRGNEQRPAVPGVFGLTVLQLDMNYVRSQLLPSLSERHFTNTAGDRYRVAVIDASDPTTVIYRSDPEAPTDVARAAEAESLYGAFRDPFGFQRGGSNGGRGGPNGGRGDARRNAGRGRGSADAESGSESGPPRFNPDSGRWALFVQHESGSLDAAVGGVRRRNLGISFGVLLMLSGSVGLLIAASRKAQRLARQQMEFVASVSHELRTPVAVIRSAAENLSQGVVGSGDRVKRYGQIIDTESRRLGEMVERVLQYAGIASGLGLGARVALVPSELIESAVAASIPLLGPLKVQRTIEPGLPTVIGDEGALRSAVQNLIANAVKYGGPDGWIGIRAELTSNGRRPEVCITVEDHGPGIPGEDLPHIFEPFYRGADAVSQQVHGNGLGLALVQQIVVAHGGRVTVSTRPGVGSAFRIFLPAADAEARATLTREAQPAHS